MHQARLRETADSAGNSMLQAHFRGSSTITFEACVAEALLMAVPPARTCTGARHAGGIQGRLTTRGLQSMHWHTGSTVSACHHVLEQGACLKGVDSFPIVLVIDLAHWAMAVVRTLRTPC
jgi:hypothetical protein